MSSIALNQVSIVISCYNDADFIEQAVQSAFNQTYSNKEVIVVDDGSSQKTKAVLKKLESKINLLTTQENQGPSAARNRGIEAATGEYILVLDSDDYFEPEFCEKALKIFQTHVNLKIVTSFGRVFWNDKNYFIFKPIGGGLENYLIQNSSLAVFFKKSDWLLVGGYDESLRKGFEDWEFYIRLHKNGGQTYVIPEVLFHYRKKKDSRTINANQYKYELLEYIYLKHIELYRQNLELFIKYIINKFDQEEKEKVKVYKTLEFQIGKIILEPLRWFKSLFMRTPKNEKQI